jgi:hypothetical protein
MSEQLSAMILEFKALLENGNILDPDAARRLLLALSIDTHDEVKRINGRLKKVEAVAEDVEEYPSLLWLLRHKTKQMVAIILIILAILSLVYVPELRGPIMEWLGLPPLITF